MLMGYWGTCTAGMAVIGMAAALSVDAAAQTDSHRPWDNQAVAIVIDPYQENSIDWDKAATDKRLKAVIHRASIGNKTDSKFETRATAARNRGLLYGGYHLGRPGDPIAQANLLLDQARKANVKFLALDIEGTSSSDMSFDDAAKFIAHIQASTGRYPAFYTNFSTYQAISAKYDKTSVFAKAPLWIARFGENVGLDDPRVWPNYTLWQFSSEINCKPGETCLYRVPGTAEDMDVNVFRGTETDLRQLFE
jgi:GH25 family lysozyme M1 (1,4-beta-N-acetylmuramidase)